jgi:hypothetical protein
MKECGNGPEVINDEDGNSHIGREISYQAGVGIETPPNRDGKVFRALLCTVRIVASFKSTKMCLVLAESLLERLQQGGRFYQPDFRAGVSAENWVSGHEGRILDDLGWPRRGRGRCALKERVRRR